MVAWRPSVLRIFRFLGFSKGLGPFFPFSCAESARHITKANDTRSRRMEGIIHDPRAVQIEVGRRTTLSGFNIFARLRGLAGCNHRRNSASKGVEEMDMKMRKNWLATAALLAALPVTTLVAGPTKQAGSIEDRVRHELVMLPYFNVFDDLSFR